MGFSMRQTRIASQEKHNGKLIRLHSRSLQCRLNKHSRWKTRRWKQLLVVVTVGSSALLLSIYIISSTVNNSVTVTFSLRYMKKPNKHHYMITSTTAKSMQINLIHTPCPIRSLVKLKTSERNKWSSERKIPISISTRKAFKS